MRTTVEQLCQILSQLPPKYSIEIWDRDIDMASPNLAIRVYHDRKAVRIEDLLGHDDKEAQNAT